MKSAIKPSRKLKWKVRIKTNIGTLWSIYTKLNLAADESAYGMGVVISQVFANSCERPIAYASRTLNKA